MKALQVFALIVLYLFSSFSCQRSGSTAEKENAPGDTSPAAGKLEVHLVEIKQMKFEPAEITVKKGDEIRWINRDITNHDVTEQSRKAWASSPLSTGESWSMVATESVDYYCNLHRVMKGKIIVE
jgi:plastocyanin